MDQIHVTCIRELEQTCGLRIVLPRLHKRPRDFDRHVLIFRSMHDFTPDRRSMRTGTGFMVATRYRVGRPAEELHDCSVAKVPLIGKPQVGYGGKRDHSFQRHGFAGQAKSQMSAGGMADYDRRTAKMFTRSFDSGHNVVECARPTPSGLVYAPILEIGRDNATRRQGRAERIRVAEIVLHPPESTVNENSEANHHLFGMPQFEKLAFAIAIGDAMAIHSVPSTNRL